MLQVTLILNIDNKDGIIESKANFRSFGVTLSGSEALLALNLAIELTIGESLFTLFASLTYAYHYLITLIK